METNIHRASSFTEDELSKQIANLSRKIKGIKFSFHSNPWEDVITKIEEIEKELELLLTFLQMKADKET